MTPDELIKFAQERFVHQNRCLPLWQTIAQHFYPERADFITSRTLGEELAEGLASSLPVIIRRDLANSFSAMLRDGQFFEMGIVGEPDYLGKKWLEFGSQRLHKLMEHRSSNFRRATKEGDNDYASFGQLVMSILPNRTLNGLLYQTWHLRDCAWWDDDEGSVGGLVRMWRPKLHQVKTFFEEKEIHANILEKMKKDLFKEMEIYHFDIPGWMYGGEYERFPWVSCYMDINNRHPMRVEGKTHRTYIVPRFQTIAGSAYAYSPATVVGLPEARTLQAMTFTLLEAGERIVRPPLIATENVVRGDANLGPDEITIVSEQYDERLGAALRTLQSDSKGFPYGFDMRAGIVEILQSAFFINKINLPETTHEMTAYEVQERMKQFRRENLPLFSPLEHEYNGQVCELSFDIAMEHNMIGSPRDIPMSLRDAEVQFKFESPLSEAEQEKKAQMFRIVSEMLAQAADFDQALSTNIDFDEAFRDSVEGVGAPMSWLADVRDARQQREQLQEQMMMAAAQEQQRIAA